MTKKQLLKKLIYHYEWCIEYLPKKNWDFFLIKWCIQYGVCYLADKFYEQGYVYFFCDWIGKYKGDYDDYWCEVPCQSKSRKECIELLTIRLNNLKKELSITK